jgi:hypothetical protein
MEQNPSICFYRVVFVNNEPVSIEVASGETKERWAVHPNGLLIFAVIRAGSAEEAGLIARQKAARQKRGEGPGS